MASMDNLRDKIRSRRADTSELDAVPTPAPKAAAPTGNFNTGPFVNAKELFEEQAPPVSPVYQDTTGPLTQSESHKAESKSNTDSLISEIFADAPVSAPAFKSDSEKAKAKPKKVKASPEPRKPIELPFLNRFKQLEVNRRMLLISLVFAAMASFLAINYLGSFEKPMVKVIKLKKDLPARTEITEAMLEIKEVPKEDLPEGALVYQPNMKLLGMMTTASVYKGEILNNSRIEDPDDIGRFKVPSGHRAMLVKTSTAMLVTPSTKDRNEYIDLIATIPDPNPTRQGKLITYPILQRALVLPLPKSDKDSTATSVPTNTISVAVPEDRVRLMVTLTKKGEFEAVPRAAEDESTTPEEYTVQEIMDALQGKFEAATTSSREDKPEPEDPPAKAEAPAPAVQAPLKELSRGSSYRAPARAPAYRAPVARAQTYRAPARTQTYRAPAARKPVYRAPAARPQAAAAPAASGRRSSSFRMPRETYLSGVKQAN